MIRKPVILGALLLFIFSTPTSLFGDPTPAPVAQAESAAAGGARVREFQGDELGQVLRLLARQAKIDLVVADGLHGQVSMRLENKTALEAIEILVRSNRLSLKNEKGVYYVETQSAAANAAVEDDPDKTSGQTAADDALDFLAKPETAARIAKYKRNLYNALLKEGFVMDQAVQIVAADRLGEVLASGAGER